MAGPIQIIGLPSVYPNAREITFSGATGENKINLKDNLADALNILEGSNSYIKFITTNGSEQIVFGKQILLPQEDDAATPTLAFGDGNTGFYEVTDNKIGISLAGTQKFLFGAGAFQTADAGGGLMPNTDATATAPAWTFRDDTDSGIGSAGADMLSLISGGEEGIRLVQDTWGISLHIPEITTPTAVANFGAIYAKADNKLYFQDGGGTEHTVTIS